MINALANLDRRIVFLMMLLAVGIPVLLQTTFPEEETQLSEDVFQQIEALDEGDKVLMAWDFDPASEGELSPMSTAFILHCANRKLKMYFVALYPPGQQMIDDDINNIIKTDFPELEYGKDYVNLGYKPGYEGVIKVITTNLRGLYTTDARGTNIDQIPMCKEIENIQEMDLIVNVSAGYPGCKEWVQYAATPYKIKMVAGVTGVQATLMYPYLPNQLNGLLGAIKGASEYEKLVVDKYIVEKDMTPKPKYLKGRQRMGPQLVAHLLMIGLIVVGNVLFFLQRRA